MRANHLLMRFIVLVLFLVVVAMTSPCFADNTIYACAQKSSGLLSMVKSCTCGTNTGCPDKATCVCWNITGPQGPAGPQGPPGVANGITTAAHGHIGANGTLISGVHIFPNLIHNPNDPNDGAYGILFTVSFSQPPDCVVSTTVPVTEGLCYISQTQIGVTVNCTDVFGNPAAREFYLLCVQ